MLKIIKNFFPANIKNYLFHLPLAIAANLFYGFPSKNFFVIGVSGTDGKTTTVNMIYKILKDQGLKVSMISTICAVLNNKIIDTGLHVTSPDPWDLQKFINLAKTAGDKYLVLEVTSHALEQFRVWGIKFHIGIITNITHDHLDYHQTFENYRRVKSSLIKHSDIAILNIDDPNYKYLKDQAKGKVFSFGLHHNAALNPFSFPLSLKLLGDFNILNAEAAAWCARIIEIPDKKIKKSLENFQSPIGRLEEIKNNRNIKIFVDFAHTPNALKNSLAALKKITKGRLIAVFGCPAERDLNKRPMMGKIAMEKADIVILTDDDPRFENQEKIIEDIIKGMAKKKVRLGLNLFKQPNRVLAIKLACDLAKPNDTLAFFGKGHEKSISYKGKEYQWSDSKVVQLALKKDQKIFGFDYCHE